MQKGEKQLNAKTNSYLKQNYSQVFAVSLRDRPLFLHRNANNKNYFLNTRIARLKLKGLNR